MPDRIEQCLGVTDSDARAQWRRIAARAWQPRQERYLPVELLLCFGLFRLFNPHGFGGANLHRLPAEAQALARALKRPVGSLTNKMLNLEGFRANGARVETELFLDLGRDADRFAALYLLAIQAARVEGFEQTDVPDFLGWLDLAPEPDLLGQDEIGVREVDLALVGASEDLRTMEHAYGFDERETSRVVEQRVRLRQHCFASQVLTQYQHRCAFCGLDASSLRGHRLLVASHVKPWAVSTNRERLDPRNGVAACTIHDSAFDTGLLTIGRDLAIQRAPALERLCTPTTLSRPPTPNDASRAEIAAVYLFGPDIIADRLLVPAAASGPLRIPRLSPPRDLSRLTHLDDGRVMPELSSLPCATSDPAPDPVPRHRQETVGTGKTVRDFVILSVLSRGVTRTARSRAAPIPSIPSRLAVLPSCLLVPSTL